MMALVVPLVFVAAMATGSPHKSEPDAARAGAVGYLHEAIDRYENRPNVLRLPESFSAGGTPTDPQEIEPEDGLLDLFSEALADSVKPFRFVLSGFEGDYWDVAASDSGKDPCVITYTPTGCGRGWAGAHFLSPANNWGDHARGVCLRDAVSVQCELRCPDGPRSVQVIAGGIGSAVITYAAEAGLDGWVTVDDTWRTVELPLVGDLSSVVRGLGIVFSESRTPEGVRLELRRPVFRGRSFHLTTGATFPDYYLEGAAHTYDAALTILALVAEERFGSGTAADRRHHLQAACLLGQALLHCMSADALARDTGGAIVRNVYSARDLSQGQTGVVPPYPDQYGSQVHTGNLAWTMLAFLALYCETGEASLLDGAERIGAFVDGHLRDRNARGGYLGGLELVAPARSGRERTFRWSSVEHNIDLSVAYRQLAILTRDRRWLGCAETAQEYVDALWESDSLGGHFAAGHRENGTVNDDLRPLDVNPWAVLANPASTPVECLAWCERACSTRFGDEQMPGFSYAAPKRGTPDGTWFEGIAHMACAYQAIGDTARAREYLHSIEYAQAFAAGANDSGVVATWEDSVATGYGPSYYHRLHIGATAWYVLADVGVNPYWMTSLHSRDPEGEFAARASEVQPAANWTTLSLRADGRSAFTPHGAFVTLRRSTTFAENAFYLRDFTSYQVTETALTLRSPLGARMGVVRRAPWSVNLVGMVSYRRDAGDSTWNRVDWNNDLVIGGGVDVDWHPAGPRWLRGPAIRQVLIRLSARALRLSYPHTTSTPKEIRPGYDLTGGCSLEVAARGVETSAAGVVQRLLNAWQLDAGLGFRYARTNLYLSTGRDFYLLEGGGRYLIDVAWPRDEAVSLGPAAWADLTYDLGAEPWNKLDWTNHVTLGGGVGFELVPVSGSRPAGAAIRFAGVRAVAGYSHRWYADKVAFVPPYRPDGDLAARVDMELAFALGS